MQLTDIPLNIQGGTFPGIWIENRTKSVSGTGAIGHAPGPMRLDNPAGARPGALFRTVCGTFPSVEGRRPAWPDLSPRGVRIGSDWSSGGDLEPRRIKLTTAQDFLAFLNESE